MSLSPGYSQQADCILSHLPLFRQTDPSSLTWLLVVLGSTLSTQSESATFLRPSPNVRTCKRSSKYSLTQPSLFTSS